MSTTEPRIAGFDGLRAIAFLLVFISHQAPLENAGVYGDVGVWMFFVLSGFLITRILARSREGIERGLTTPRLALMRFYIRRTARIFPPYYLVLGIALVISAFTPVDNFWLSARIAYAFFLTNIFIGLRDAWIGDFGPFWSLAVEEQFYLVFAPLVLALPRSRVGPLCIGFIVVGLATKVGMEIMGAAPTPIDVHSLINFGLLGFGGLVGLNLDRRVPAWLLTGPAQAATGLIYLALPVAFGAWSGPWMTYGKLSGLLAGLLLFQIARAQQTRFVAILESAPLRGIGRISYGAYLFHHFIHFAHIQAALGWIGWRLDAARPLQVLVELAATLVLATLSWRFLERPIVTWAAHLTSRGRWAEARA